MLNAYWEWWPRRVVNILLVSLFIWWPWWVKFPLPLQKGKMQYEIYITQKLCWPWFNFTYSEVMLLLAQPSLRVMWISRKYKRFNRILLDWNQPYIYWYFTIIFICYLFLLEILFSYKYLRLDMIIWIFWLFWFQIDIYGIFSAFIWDKQNIWLEEFCQKLFVAI